MLRGQNNLFNFLHFSAMNSILLCILQISLFSFAVISTIIKIIYNTHKSSKGTFSVFLISPKKFSFNSCTNISLLVLDMNYFNLPLILQHRRKICHH
jgi:hypothetical protein